ncbi:hypothetical protein TA3x_005325 [Tundrisphaera sp. TA3]|uniref:hypothetical protein n=1 Tax=Tundrisphaera sp. TA3 TaxID=3435775 RepID=UPI003EBE4D45
MSGPIVRKYGFPNFEAIFGKRELKHGVDEPKPEESAGNEPKPDEATGKVEPKKD